MEEGACSACGTPFGSLFREPDQAPARDPGRAGALSFLFPGLGHFAAGKPAEGLARAVAFLWMAGTAVAILVVRRGIGLGPFLPLVVLLAAAAAVIYAMSVPDARRAVRGQPPVLTTRIMMYGVSGMMLITVLVLMITSIRARG